MMSGVIEDRRTEEDKGYFARFGESQSGEVT